MFIFNHYYTFGKMALIYEKKPYITELKTLSLLGRQNGRKDC